jgi:hypothetical protein
MEIGVTDAVQRHVQRHVVAPKPVSQRKLDFEHGRPRWMREMAAETLGVFLYVWVFWILHWTRWDLELMMSGAILVLPHKHPFS